MTDRRQQQRGFVVVTALVIALLFFSLIGLLLVDSSRSLVEAQQFRARVVAQTLAENGAELAARNLITAPGGPVSREDEQGIAGGTVKQIAGGYELVGDGTSAGVIRSHATVRLQVRVAGNAILIDYSTHTP